MKAYLDVDEWYPWLGLSTSKGYFDVEVEMSEEQYKELSEMLSVAHLVQKKLKQLHPEWKDD